MSQIILILSFAMMFNLQKIKGKQRDGSAAQPEQKAGWSDNESERETGEWDVTDGGGGAARRGNNN